MSPVSYTHLTVEQHKPEEGLRVLLEGFAHYFNCTAEALGPVSYTHLDVYKRQDGGRG